VHQGPYKRLRVAFSHISLRRVSCKSLKNNFMTCNPCLFLPEAHGSWLHDWWTNSLLTALFNAIVSNRVLLQILTMTNKYSWQNWDWWKSPVNREIRIIKVHLYGKICLWLLANHCVSYRAITTVSDTCSLVLHICNKLVTLGQGLYPKFQKQISRTFPGL